ncbi:hypothetical protein ACFXHA_45255 [Nocardia sp. NPDC059240]|uniref:hypothetical protein n=1 Tax=Nocardia sp. NPDC059240 TaxID=3346786 RepID=UPI0036A4BB06
MTTVYDSDVTVTMRSVTDATGLPHTVNPIEVVDRQVLVELREGPPGTLGPQGDPSWPWTWAGDIASFAALQALHLGTADARKAWRVVDEQALYLWSGMEFVRMLGTFQAVGHQAPPTTLAGSATAGPTGSAAAVAITGTAPDQQLAITFPRGVTGDVGDPGVPGPIRAAEDVGDLSGARQDAVLAWNAAAGEWQPRPAPRIGGPWAIAASQFTGGGSNLSASPRTLATMNIPAQPYPWRPIVIAGNIGIQNHVSAYDAGRVNVEIRLGAIDGPLIGYGVSTALANNSVVQFYPRWDYAIADGSTHATVAANVTAAIYVLAKRATGNANYSVQTANAQLVIMAQPL